MNMQVLAEQQLVSAKNNQSTILLRAQLNNQNYMQKRVHQYISACPQASHISAKQG